ncbi:zinc finger BED domain-containing protein 5-like [Macrobrachium nipponense]|uniref:zinc finger BED domain-containing protein 5-like n=1 Tax=Macrobrachium nipponense TaxID=159736 RepID=UPI0030C89B39
MPMFLLCMTSLSNESMRPSKLKKHLETAHKDKKDKPLDFFKKLRDEFQGRMTVNHMFTQKVAKVDRGMLASYKIANLIAKAGKPHTIGESLIMPAVACSAFNSHESESTRVGQNLDRKLVDAKSDIFYLSDIFEKLNVLNKELQGNNSTMFSCKEAITTFKGKLKLFWLNLGRREFAQFPSLAVISTDLLDDDLAVYVDHLKQLHNDMDTRF